MTKLQIFVHRETRWSREFWMKSIPLAPRTESTLTGRTVARPFLGRQLNVYENVLRVFQFHPYTPTRLRTFCFCRIACWLARRPVIENLPYL
jgi:hypothetical protein